jgi:hypothetical protein
MLRVIPAGQRPIDVVEDVVNAHAFVVNRPAIRSGARRQRQMRFVGSAAM